MENTQVFIKLYPQLPDLNTQYSDIYSFVNSYNPKDIDKLNFTCAPTIEQKKILAILLYHCSEEDLEYYLNKLDVYMASNEFIMLEQLFLVLQLRMRENDFTSTEAKLLFNYFLRTLALLPCLGYHKHIAEVCLNALFDETIPSYISTKQVGEIVSNCWS